MLIIMPTTTLLNSHGVFGGVSPMWCATGRPAASISSQTGFMAVLRVVDQVAVVVLARVQRQQERLEPQRFQLVQCPSSALRIPPVDQPGAVEVPIGALLQLGDVLVVDAERELAKFLVRVVEKRQDGVGEGEFLVDAVLAQLLDPGLDVGARGARQVVVLHQHRAEVARQERLPLAPDLVGAVLVPDPRRLVLEIVREALVEDVVGQRNVVVRGENHGPLRQAHIACRWRGRADPWVRQSLRAGRAKRCLSESTSVSLQSDRHFRQ